MTEVSNGSGGAEDTVGDDPSLYTSRYYFKVIASRARRTTDETEQALRDTEADMDSANDTLLRVAMIRALRRYQERPKI